MSKSPDAFRTISEVADWLEIQAHVLRFWESKFNQVKPVKRAGGRRYYRPSDMLLLGGIQHLLHDKGLSIKDVQALIREQGVQHVQDLSKPLDPEEAEQEADTPPPSKWADPAEQETQKPRSKPVDRDPPEEEAQPAARKAAPPTPPPFSPPAPAPTTAPEQPATQSEAPDSHASDSANMAPPPGPDAGPGTDIPAFVASDAQAGGMSAEPPAETSAEPQQATAEESPAHQFAPAEVSPAPADDPAPETEAALDAGQITMPLDLPNAAPPQRELPHSTPPAPRSGAPMAEIPGQQDFFGAASDAPETPFAEQPPAEIPTEIPSEIKAEDALQGAPMASSEPFTEDHLLEDDFVAPEDVPTTEGTAYPADPDQPATSAPAEPQPLADTSGITSDLAAAMAQAAQADSVQPPQAHGSVELPDLQPDPDAPPPPSEELETSEAVSDTADLDSALLPDAPAEDVDAAITAQAMEVAEEEEATTSDMPLAVSTPAGASHTEGDIAPGVLSRLSALEYLPPEARGTLAEIVRDLRNCLS